MKTLPEEPTAEMIESGLRIDKNRETPYGLVVSIYRAMYAAAPDVSAEPVGVAGEMPGSNGGFSMAVFRAIDVPVGTKLYTNPAPSPDHEPMVQIQARGPGQ